MIRILLIDDHVLFREGVGRLLQAEPDFEVVGSCDTLEQAAALLRDHPVDVLLLDYDLGVRKGSELLRQLGSDYKGRVLVLTAGVSGSQARELVQLGASGIFLKHHSPALLAQSIRQIYAGGTYMDDAQLRALLAPPEDRTSGFTEREKLVLRYVVEGQSNKEIASSISTSESTVKAVLQSLFDKTGVRSRSQLVRIALEQYPKDL